MAEYEPIFANPAGAPPPPPIFPPLTSPAKKKGKKKKKAAVPIVAYNIEPNLLPKKKKKGIAKVEEVVAGDDEEFVQSVYSSVGAATEESAKAGKQTTTFGRVCFYLLLVKLVIYSIGAIAFVIMFMMGVKLPL